MTHLPGLVLSWFCGLLLTGEAQAAIHNPAFDRYLSAVAVLAAYFVFCLWIFRRHRRRVTAMASMQRSTNGKNETVLDGASLLVAYASQSGFARDLAFRTVDSLQEAGMRAYCLALDDINAAMLGKVSRALFVVSTTGEGDAPDNARAFVQRTMPEVASLRQLQYGILALGDSSYANFCGFGHQLDAWLQHVHALPLFDLVQVDAGDAGALRHWQYQLGLLAGSTAMADWQTPQYQVWRLLMRKQLNAGSTGAPVYHLALRSDDAGIAWQAGDIAEIGPRHLRHEVEQWMTQLGMGIDTLVDGRTLLECLQGRMLPEGEHEVQALQGLPPDELLARLQPLPHREYSIASLPGDGHLELLVRQASHGDGRLGLGSGWLTRYAEIGGDIALRIRENAAFHPPAAHDPMILIGNGTGIAGLRAHLKARAISAQAPNWLLFGERHAAHDFHFESEIRAWQSSGLIERLDVVFSRDQADKQYVQHVLARHAELLRDWVARRAAIYVCGSANGMAQEVHTVLLDTLGEDTLTQLALDGRYRRDIY
ncbi:sulfite reductase subunit alpha [Methylobacillus sp.]|uniref:sulfite reductase subunit alpha n=1 Tax=Methylobacillus sp. TaxID=56818 RepID=UPI002FE27C93